MGMCAAAVVQNVLVDLIGDGERVELLAQAGNEGEVPRA